MSRYDRILGSRQALMSQVRKQLDGRGLSENWTGELQHGKVKGSAVLFILTQCRCSVGGTYEPCVLLNKRSQKVLQPGDLCCPGGGVERADRMLSWLLHLPRSPLRRWPAWPLWKNSHGTDARFLSLLMATALRESWEEMRLNPFKVTFLGPLPVQHLVMFQRQIYPLVGWVPPDQRLVPNWEVESIVHIPLRRLLDPRHYARYRLKYRRREDSQWRLEDFPCFVHNYGRTTEILWGATFRITLDFLRRVFGFDLPQLQHATVIKGQLGSAYTGGTQG